MLVDTTLTTLENYDLTRKVFAVNTMDILSRLINAEAAQTQPNLLAIAALSSSMASLLASVS